VRRGLGTAAVLAFFSLPTIACDETRRDAESVAFGMGVVVSVTDGDTLRLRDGRRVRLVQIDAPEEATDCYGHAATAELGALAPRGTTAALARDPLLDGVDDYGRVLRYLVVDGVNVNVELVRRGAAVPYFFRGARGRYADELLSAAREARDARRGLWGSCPAARLDPGRGALTGPA
jgi:endonuclease YncB( thermonuclease family)